MSKMDCESVSSEAEVRSDELPSNPMREIGTQTETNALNSANEEKIKVWSNILQFIVGPDDEHLYSVYFARSRPYRKKCDC